MMNLGLDSIRRRGLDSGAADSPAPPIAEGRKLAAGGRDAASEPAA
jgi:hypothetical protein